MSARAGTGHGSPASGARPARPTSSCSSRGLGGREARHLERQLLDRATPDGARLAGVTQPHVLCMQETKHADAAFPTVAFADLGYQSAHHGEGRWNGVRHRHRWAGGPIPAGFRREERRDDGRAQVVAARPCRHARVDCGLRPNGRTSTSRAVPAKLAWLARLRAYLDERADPSGADRQSAATSTSPRPTPTSGTPPVRRGDPRERPRAGRPGLAPRLGTGGCLPAVPSRGRPVQLVGLPCRRLPQGPRHADRPRPLVGRPAGRCTGARSTATPARRARRGTSPGPPPLFVEIAD